jgi:hyperosmotically inducible protein
MPKHSKATIAAAVLTVLFASGCQKHEAGDVANTGPGTTPPAESSSSTAGTAGTTGGTTATTPASPSTPAEAATADNKSAGEAVDDTVTTTKVKTALLADSDIKGLQINVDTSNGVVTLSGAVDNQTQIDRAGKLAADVQGVKSVTNNLTIKK